MFVNLQVMEKDGKSNLEEVVSIDSKEDTTPKIGENEDTKEDITPKIGRKRHIYIIIHMLDMLDSVFIEIG